MNVAARLRPWWALFAVALLWTGLARAESRREVHVVGSSTLYAFTAVVAEAFAGTTDNPAPDVEATGAGGGFKLFCAGLGLKTPDIVTASRPITADEMAVCAANGVGDMSRHIIGYGGVVVVQARKAGAKRDVTLNPTRRQLWLALAKTVPVNGVLVANP